MKSVIKDKKLKNRIMSLLYPKRCMFCRAIIPLESDFCDYCAKRLPNTVYQKYAAGGVRCCSPLMYKGVYADAVKRMKFRGKKHYARPLAILAAGAAARVYDLSLFDFVTCVPMHKRSMRKRRFNQAEELAKELCAVSGLKFVNTLEKSMANKPQHTLKRSERAKNVKGVFRVPDKSLVAGKNILIVDDIITTGCTLGECAEVLKKAGCAQVCCVTVCSTVM